MEHPRLAATAAAVALGVGLTLVPAVAHAATPTPERPVAASSSVAHSPITSVEQRRAGDRVVLTVAVDRVTAVAVQDASGDVVDIVDASPWTPARFLLTGAGASSATYTVSDHEGAYATPVTVDFSGIELVAPVEQTTEDQLLVMQAQVLRGQVDHVLRFAAVPGAEVSVTVNGVETSAVAGRSGIAEVSVRFRAGVNAVSVSQALNGFTSATAQYAVEF